MESQRAAPRTIAEAFHDTVATNPDRVAVRTIDDTVKLTWGDVQRRVHALAGGLARLGVRRGDTVALMLANRPEFHIVDLAVTVLRATPFSIYPTLSPEQIAYVVGDAGARIAVVETAFLDSFLAAKRTLPQLEQVVLVDGEGRQGLVPLADVEGANPGFDVESAWRAVVPEDLLTLIYTSGTTGPPKGVQLTHRNLLACARVVREQVQLPDGARVISWLPAAHIAERAAHHYLPIVFGGTITCCPNPREVVTYLPRVRPNWFFAVPRIWEKMKAGLEARIAGLSEAQRQMTERAIAAAREKIRLEQAGKSVPAALAEQVATVDAELFAPLRAMLGLDQAAAVNVGAAPTPPEVIEFFHAIGIPLGELWGMSETSGSGTMNPIGRVKIGTVGLPVPGVEIKLAADGEVLIRGDVVMPGYRNQPEKTAEVLDADGWLATGDIGELDADGYLRITDRKKDLIVTAGGKNVAPQPIENRLKTHPLVEQVIMVGDRRRYCSLLIVPAFDRLESWARAQGIAWSSREDLVRDPRVVSYMESEVLGSLADLASFEKPKKIALLAEDLTVENGFLTPSMKVKRRVVQDRLDHVIDRLYSEEAVDATQ